MNSHPASGQLIKSQARFLCNRKLRSFDQLKIRTLTQPGVGDSQRRPVRMALHAAARNGDVTALMAAVAAGQPLDDKDNLARTPLHLASWAGKTEIVRLLLAHGCNASAAASDDVNALHFAAQKGHVEPVRLLLNAGIHVNSRTRKGATALAMAAQNGHVEVVKLLLQRKANPSTANHKGQTPLQLAKGEEVRELLQARVDAGEEEGLKEAPAEEDGQQDNPARAKKLRGAQKGGKVLKAQQSECGPQNDAAEGEGNVAPEAEEEGEPVMIGPAPPPALAGSPVRQDKTAQPAEATQEDDPGPAAAQDSATTAAATAGGGGGGEKRSDSEQLDKQPPGKKQKIILSFGDEDE